MEHLNANQKINPWTLSVDAVLVDFNTSLQGLNVAEAQQRLK